MMKALASVSCATAVAVASVLAAAPAVQADTSTFRNVTLTFHSAVPCVGPASITAVVNGDVHLSANPGGGSHETDNTTGTFSAALDAGGTSSGHFMVWSAFDTADGVTGVGTFAFNGEVTNGVGAGTSWHENAQYVGPVDPTSVAKLAFDYFHCSRTGRQ